MAQTDPCLSLTPLPGESSVLGFVDALAQLTFTVQGAIGRMATEHDLSIVQARLLGILRDRRATIKELANFLQLEKSSVTGLVDRAEERGLVRRTPSSLDGRSVQVTITVAGQKLIKQAAAVLETEIAELVADISSTERDRLAATASRIVAADARRRGIEIFNSEPLVTMPNAPVPS